MTFTIELPDEQVAALEAKAQALGMPAESYARQILERDLENRQEAREDERPISQIIAEIMSDVPPEELAKLPEDGASEHDHYIYGWPKRKQ